MGLLDEVSSRRSDIATDTYTTTWREVINQYREGALTINPEYQRLFRWTIDQQTQYLESIILGIPSPAIFLAENEDGKQEVLDGLQRVSTILKFFAEEVHKNPVLLETSDENENDMAVPTTLAEGPILKSLEGFTAKTLPEALLLSLRNSRITVILVERKSTKLARYEVFRRLNKFGSVLSDQEIRNCTARLFGGEFPQQLIEVANTQEVRDSLSIGLPAERKMLIEEMLLRLLALNYSAEPLKHSVSEYLDNFMTHAAEGKFKLTDDIRARVQKTFRLIAQAFPEGRAFRFARGGFSTNLFDVVASGALQNADNLSVESFREKHAALLQSDEIKDVTGAGSNTKKKLQGRLELGKRWFAA